MHKNVKPNLVNISSCKLSSCKLTSCKSCLVAVGFLLNVYSSSLLANTPMSSEQANKSVQASSVVPNDIDVALELRSLLAKTTTFQADFEQQITDSENRVLQNAEGKIVLAKPNKMRWQTTFPDDTLLVADGISVYNVDSAVEQMTIFEQDDIGKNNPLMLLVSNDQSKWEQVTVNRTAQKGQFVILNTNENAILTSVLLTFNESQLVELESSDIQGQSNKLVFKNGVSNAILADDVFDIQIPDEYIIDDQRGFN